MDYCVTHHESPQPLFRTIRMHRTNVRTIRMHRTNVRTIRMHFIMCVLFACTV